MALRPKQKRFIEEYLVDLNATQAAIRAKFDLPICGMELGFYVYLLTDSRNGEIFYVGKGKGRRYQAHERAWRRSRLDNGSKALRIGEILESGGQVQALAFATGLTESVAYELERAMIRAIGLSRLCNASPGQTTSREWASAMLAKVKPYPAWVAERAPSSFEKDLYWGVVKNLQQMAA